MIWEHTQGKNHTFAKRGRAFADNSGLVRHKRVHTGEKPYICKTRVKAFIVRSDLLVHITGVHTGIVAQHVDKPLRTSHLIEHMRVHAVSCSSLTVRIRRVHAGEKQHVCKTCGKTFTTKAMWSCHMRRVHKSEVVLQNLRKKIFGSHFSNHKRTHQDG